MDRKEAINILAYNAINATGTLGALPPTARETKYLNEQIKALNMAIEALQEPEIVHCKDCKLRKLEECAMQYECDCGEQHSWENDNDYCSWGIKAGEQE